MDLPENSVLPRADEGPPPRRVGPVDREELVRVMAQSLYSLGYRRAAAVLEAESGVPLYPPEHDRLLFDVMAGRWDACAETVRSVAGVSDSDRAVAEFLVWRGHYLELLGMRGDASLRRAREVLRSQIAPLGVDRRCVHWLARAMVSCDGAVAPEAVVGWRIAVFLDLVEVFPPWFHVPSGRLEHLVESAVTKQVASCIYHNLPDETTLFEDHKCHEERIPSHCAQILCGHNNEVWFVRFSNNGKYLASSSSDCTAIIWKLKGTFGLALAPAKLTLAVDHKSDACLDQCQDLAEPDPMTMCHCHNGPPHVGPTHNGSTSGEPTSGEPCTDLAGMSSCADSQFNFAAKAQQESGW